jgi:hypothetical protein
VPQGEVGVPEVEKAGRPALRFDSKAHGRNALSTPRPGHRQRQPAGAESARPASGAGAATDERPLPTPSLPMNRPPPDGRRSSDAPDAPATTAAEGSHGTR